MPLPISHQFSLKNWVLLASLFLFSSPLFSATQQIDFTEQERQWLASHPVVTVGIDQNWPPFEFINTANEHQGISSSYLNHLSKTLHIHFKIVAGNWENALNGVKSQQLDMLACATDTKKRRKFLNFTSPYIKTDSVFVTRISQPPVNSLADLSGKIVALSKNTYVHERLKKQADISFLFVKSSQQALQAVSLGKANAYVGKLAVVSHFIEKDLLTNLRIDNYLTAEKSRLGFAVRKDLPLLHSILQKGLDAIPVSKHREITRKWINFDLTVNNLPTLSLTAEQISWLKIHKNIRIGVDPAWAPIEFINRQTKTYEGIASEYVNYLEKALAINTHYPPDLNWEQVIKKIKSADIDILPAVSKTPEREKYLNFTKPYLSFPYVIFTRNDADIITNIVELLDKKIVVEKNYANHEILLANFPEIELTLVDNTQQALSALSLGQVDAYMGNLATTSHIILQTGITNIKVAAPTPFNNDIAFAVRKDWPELTLIIQQALDSISTRESNAFKKKWFSIRYDHLTDTSLLWKIILASATVLLLFSLWLWQIRKQKETLRLSEERFKFAMQASKEGVWDWNIETNEVYFSPGYSEMLGYQANELENNHLSWETLLHPDDKKTALALVADKVANCAKHYEHVFRLRHKLGHYIDIHSFGSIICTEKGKATRAVGTQVDITEQKITELTLQQQKFALDTAAIVAITDVKSIITYVNDNFCDISGYSRKELIGQNHRIINSGAHPASMWGEMYSQASKGIPWRREICNKAKDGSLYWVDSTIIGLFTPQGKLEQFIAIRSDISNRKLTEQKLRQSEQQFSSLIHNIPSTFYQYVFKKGGIRDWNISFITDAIESVSGYSASLFDSNQMVLADITHPDDIHLIGETICKAIEAQQAYAVEYRIIHKDQSIRWLYDKGIPIYDDENQPLYLQGAIFDITENKQAELELEKARQSAVLASRFKSEFLSNMSHEIRTPMNAIVGLGYLALQTDLTKQQQDYINKIQNASQSLLTIINDILDFSKIEAGKLHLESVNFELDNIFETLGDLFRLPCEQKNIDLIFDINQKTPATLIGDPTRLSQILNNLCSNAIKFTEQGEIKISVAPAEVSASKTVLNFSVTDTGCGIAKDKQHQLFDSFFQTDTSTTRIYGGTGLGLAISKQLVEMMDGTIGINSILGQGSTFFFSIECGLDSEQNKQLALPQPDLRGLRVLVVNDNISGRNIVRNQLASLSFKVTTVASANEAYSVLKSAEKPFDLVLLDWSLPGISGLDAIKYIKNDIYLAKIPIISMVTSTTQKQVAIEAKNNNIDGFIVKPTLSSTLFDTIITVLKPSQPTASLKSKIKQSTLSGLVLIVEDNKINQQIAKELLKSFGLTVKIAENGLEAIEKISQHASKNNAFDLILMDIQMPKMDGIQATKKIRSNPDYASLPIIAMTAHAMVGDREKSLDAGMNEHITKPIDPTELYKVLQLWLQQSKNTDTRAMAKPMTNETESLPTSSGNIDVNLGLTRVGGNKSLFNKLLKDFHHDHQNDIARIQQAFDENQLETANRIIHTVKGVSGNIGAHKLQQLSAKLEQAIKSDEDYSANLTLFTQAFSDLMSELKQFGNQNQPTQKEQ